MEVKNVHSSKEKDIRKKKLCMSIQEYEIYFYKDIKRNIKKIYIYTFDMSECKMKDKKKMI